MQILHEDAERRNCQSRPSIHTEESDHGTRTAHQRPDDRDHDLRRTFKSRKSEVEAVRGVDLSVGAGEIFGFLGPNGAGKTTTLRMLATLLTPTSGEATVAGADLRREPQQVRERIGYVPQGGRPIRPRPDEANSSSRAGSTA